MKKRRQTSPDQLLLFSAPATTAGLGRQEAKQLHNQLTAQLARKFGVGWEAKSDLDNEAAALRIERRKHRTG
jgi:hypothetical protein